MCFDFVSFAAHTRRYPSGIYTYIDIPYIPLRITYCVSNETTCSSEPKDASGNWSPKRLMRRRGHMACCRRLHSNIGLCQASVHVYDGVTRARAGAAASTTSRWGRPRTSSGRAAARRHEEFTHCRQSSSRIHDRIRVFACYHDWWIDLVTPILSCIGVWDVRMATMAWHGRGNHMLHWSVRGS